MLRIDHPFSHLMGGDRGWNEDDLVEIKGLPYLLCPTEMAKVDRIEGPPEQPDLFLVIFPFNRSTFLV